MTPDTGGEQFESFERINSIRETNGNFDSCNSCKRLVLSRLHELHETKFPFVSRIEFIRSKLSDFSAHVSGVDVSRGRRIISIPGGHAPLVRIPAANEESSEVVLGGAAAIPALIKIAAESIRRGI